jgi:hypothetical protein
VRLFLRVNGEQVPLAQVGGGRLYFDEPVTLAPGPAEVLVEIDGETKPRSVWVVGYDEPRRVHSYIDAPAGQDSNRPDRDSCGERV